MGTVHCVRALRSIGSMEDEAPARTVVAAIDRVSKALGNTRAVCRKHYVHPVFLELYEKGELYKATDTRLDRTVAIKVLPEHVAADPDRQQRFEREAKTLAALNQPHIAQIHGFEQSGSTSALVMELVEGEDLADRIKRGPIPIDEVMPIAQQIAEALLAGVLRYQQALKKVPAIAATK